MICVFVFNKVFKKICGKKHQIAKATIFFKFFQIVKRLRCFLVFFENNFFLVMEFSIYHKIDQDECCKCEKRKQTLEE